MKARVLSYYEIEDKFVQILTELSKHPLDEESVIEVGRDLPFLLQLCVSQMKAPNAGTYPEKNKHIATLEKASAAITYKINACTVEEINKQVNAAYRAFGAH